MMENTTSKRLALLAGNDRLPLLVARSARAAGYQVIAFGFKGMMIPELDEAADQVFEFPFCHLGSIFHKMEESGIKQAVTIGNIAQTNVIGGMPRFDDLALEVWRRLPDRRVDTIMEILVREIEKRGIEVLPSARFLEDHLAPRGVLTERAPTDKEWGDLRFGFRMARAIGGLDIGQTVVVKHRAVMSVEAVEGTDAAIRRGGELARGGAVVVKVAKPRQDPRFDVPAVGRETIEAMHRAGANLLAVEAGRVLIVEKEPMITWADEAGIGIVGVTEEEVREDES